MPLPLPFIPPWQIGFYQCILSGSLARVIKFSDTTLLILATPALHSQCLKITEKVSYKIASEASYVYILSGQKLIKSAKNGPLWRVLKT